MNYQINLPYPKPQVERENIEYAKILSNDYAGSISESTQIHLYMYQALVLENDYPYISNVLENIAIVEMKHLKLLGRTIKLLGLKPKFVTFSEDNIKQFWTSANVNYTTSLQNILKQNIKTETIAIETYKEHKNKIDDSHIKVLLERIIKDEELHLSIFKNFYEQQKN